MNKFVVTGLTVVRDDSPFSFDSYNMNFTPTTITLELSPCNITSESVKQLFKTLQSGNLITINSAEYVNTVKPFKKEFKEFIMERYPEVIIKDNHGFNELFKEE